MSRDVVSVSWPAARLGDVIEALAVRAGIAEAPRLAGRSDDIADAWFEDPDGPLDAWVAATAARSGAEAEPVQCEAAETADVVRRLAPAVVAIRGADGARRLVAILSARGRTAVVLTSDLGTARVRTRDVAEALRRDVVAPLEAEVAKLVDVAGVAASKRARVMRALVDRVAAKKAVRGMWLVRPGPAATLRVQGREDRLGRLVVLLVGSHAAQYALWIGSWALLGRAAFTGRIETGWLVAWGLVLLALLPFRVLDTIASGRLAQKTGAMLRRRMLQGALRLDPEEIRHEGVGSLLGQAMETDQIEQSAVSGAHLCVTSSVELVFATAVVAMGAGGAWHASLLVAWIALAALIAWRALVARRQWTETRLRLTNDMVERMVGHRTRVAQLAPEKRHEGEDADLDGYLAASKRMDRHAVRLEALLPRGWLVLGLAGAAPAFLAREPGVEPLAVSLGGVFLAYQAFRGLGIGLDRAVGARVAWERIRDLWRAATRPSNPGLPGFAAGDRVKKRRNSCDDVGPSEASKGVSAFLNPVPADDDAGTSEAPRGVSGFLDPVPAVVLEAHGVQLTHRFRATPVLRGLDLEIREGDRILLEGPSGSGKSSLVSLLAGCRRADAGLLLLRGLDRGTLGDEAWRRRAVVAPQFHENHMILGPLAFNLLLGRRWPPEEKDLKEADEVCRGLGLGPVLDRMPGGLQQLVGETGWQLSHGEQSRVFLARTLLQGADVIFLDETFAALDPANFARCMEYVKRRAPALLVIAHR